MICCLGDGRFAHILRPNQPTFDTRLTICAQKDEYARSRLARVAELILPGFDLIDLGRDFGIGLSRLLIAWIAFDRFNKRIMALA